MTDRYLIVVEPEDNVATAIRDVEAGESVDIDRRGTTVTVNIHEDIPFGHKIALEDIGDGETICKYGVSVGYASRDIDAGEWVHAHNVDSNYGRGDLADNNEAVVSE